MIRLDGLLVFPLVKRIDSQELCLVDYQVVYLETWNATDMNEVSNGNILLT